MSNYRLLELSSPASIDGPQAWAYAGYANVDRASSAFASGEPGAGYLSTEVIADLNFNEDVVNRIVVARRRAVWEDKFPELKSAPDATIMK